MLLVRCEPKYLIVRFGVFFHMVRAKELSFIGFTLHKLSLMDFDLIDILKVFRI